MTDFEKIDSEEKFLEVYGDVRFNHCQMDFDILRDADNHLCVHEFPASWHKPEDTLLYKFGFIGEHNFWMYREAFRFEEYGVEPIQYKRIELDGLRNFCAYKYLDEHPDFRHLFPHTSMTRDGMVAFTPDAQKGRQDRQVRMKFGKFFRRYFTGNISDDDLKYLSNEFMGKYAPLEIKWASGKDIAKVYGYYHEGFSSCMAGDHDFDCRDHHPAEVYDSPDIKLAYFGNPETERVSARCLINVKEKEFSVVYGNEQLRDMLQDLGYKKGDLLGCRLKKIHLRGERYVMPYLDGTAYFDDYDSEYFIVAEEGGWCAGSTSGVVYLQALQSCDCCGEPYPEDDLQDTYDDAAVCGYCLDEEYRYAHVPGGDYAYVRYDEVVWSEIENEYFEESMVDDEIVHVPTRDDYCLKDECVWSARQQEWIYSDDAIEVEVIKVVDTDYVHQDFEIEDEGDLRVA